MTSCHETLERYLNIRGKVLIPTTVAHYRTHVSSFINFLRCHYPDIDSFAKVRRVPHVESWLRSLKEAEPRYTDATRDQFILKVRRFLRDIRAWGWPESASAGLFRRADFPKRKYTPRPRKPRKYPNSEFPVADNVFHQVLKRYLDIRGATLRPSSLKHYRTHLLLLTNFLQTNFPDVDSLAKVQRSHTEAWLQALAKAQPPYKNSTRRKCIRNVRRFFEDIQDWDWPGIPSGGPLIRPDDFPPPQHYLPKPLPPDSDANLMEGLRKEGGLLSLGLMLARKTGLRIGELCRLELSCLNENPEGRYSIRVPLGKLRSEREIPVDRETARIVEAIREKRGKRPVFLDPETKQTFDYLFCNEQGALLHPNLFGRKMKQVGKNCGILQNIYPHRLRHTYATELLRNGVSLPGVMRLLGHTTLRMTLRYVEVTNDDLGRDYLKAMERARLQYAKLKSAGKADTKAQQPAESIIDAFDHLIARVQIIRLDQQDPARRRRLQRFVERLRRAQGDLPNILR